MFGTKLRTWMEAHIVRSKKKKDRKKGEKGFDSNCNSPRNHGSHRSPALHQVHPVDSPSKNVDGIRLHGEEGTRCGTVTASSGTSAGTGSVNLSSPESAYSTGYSTDGTSPGTSYPPEYYINIRTGTHYFQSNANSGAAATAGNCSSNANDNNGNSCTCSSSSNNNNDNNDHNRNDNARSKKPIVSSDLPVAALLSARRHGRYEGKADTSASTSATVFPCRNADHEPSPRDGRTNAPSKIAEDHRPTDEDRSDQRRAVPQDRYYRRTESFSAESSRSNLIVPPSSIPPPLLSPTVQSPRERSRIRTNPWLSANSSGSSTTGFKSRLNLDDTSSGSGLKLTESSGSASDINASCGARVGRARRELKQESLSAGRSPINQNWRIASGMEIRPKIPLSVQRRSSNSSSSSSSSNGTSGGSGSSRDSSNVSNGRNDSGSSTNDSEDENRNGNGNENANGNENENENENGNDSSASSITRSARSSEDDITLNEMMGKFDESYVYEKETDILSDSDPTDCEDYIESLSDLDAARDAGDENDPFDNDDFDYIDNGSFLDLGNLDCTGRFANTGHCTYFAFTGELARRSSRLRESLLKRRSKEDTAMLQRTISAKSTVKNTGKKQIARHKKQPDEKQPNDKRKKRSSQRRKLNFGKHDSDVVPLGAGSHNDGDNCDDEDETANLNRVLVERMLLKNSGFNQGSRSVGGTPICLRRKKHDANKNLSPLRLNDKRSPTVRVATGVPDAVKRRSNSVSYVNGNLVRQRITSTDKTYMTTFASEIALMEADKEADKKYRQLILEAENILVNMQKNQNNLPIVPSPSRKLHNGLANKRVELIKNTELNIELALSKSRNSQPELQSGSIKDLEHTSPKRQQFVQSCSPMRRFVERNASSPIGAPTAGTATTASIATTTTFQSNSIKYPVDSPLVSRRTPNQRSPDRSLLSCSRPRIFENQVPDDYDARRATAIGTPVTSTATAIATTAAAASLGMFNCNGILDSNADRFVTRSQTSYVATNKPCAISPFRDSLSGINRTEFHASRASNVAGKEEGVTSSSSDSEEKCDVRRRPPLMTFRSVDMGPIKEGSSYCPQSEPVKRKVYAGSATYGRIQKTLGEHVTLRSSDGDTATDDTDDSRRSLKEKVARLRQERLAANMSANTQDSQMFQHQLSQLRRQMLMQTIEGLKRSLEDQSATLKQTCLEPVMTDRLP